MSLLIPDVSSNDCCCKTILPYEIIYLKSAVIFMDFNTGYIKWVIHNDGIIEGAYGNITQHYIDLFNGEIYRNKNYYTTYNGEIDTFYWYGSGNVLYDDDPALLTEYNIQPGDPETFQYFKEIFTSDELNGKRPIRVEILQPKELYVNSIINTDVVGVYGNATFYEAKDVYIFKAFKQVNVDNDYTNYIMFFNRRDESLLKEYIFDGRYFDNDIHFTADIRVIDNAFYLYSGYWRLYPYISDQSNFLFIEKFNQNEHTTKVSYNLNKDDFNLGSNYDVLNYRLGINEIGLDENLYGICTVVYTADGRNTVGQDYGLYKINLESTNNNIFEEIALAQDKDNTKGSLVYINTFDISLLNETFLSGYIKTNNDYMLIGQPAGTSLGIYNLSDGSLVKKLTWDNQFSIVFMNDQYFIVSNIDIVPYNDSEFGFIYKYLVYDYNGNLLLELPLYPNLIQPITYQEYQSKGYIDRYSTFYFVESTAYNCPVQIIEDKILYHAFYENRGDDDSYELRLRCVDLNGTELWNNYSLLYLLPLSSSSTKNGLYYTVPYFHENGILATANTILRPSSNDERLRQDIELYSYRDYIAYPNKDNTPSSLFGGSPF